MLVWQMQMEHKTKQQFNVAIKQNYSSSRRYNGSVAKNWLQRKS